jgi:hypothetical protein
MTRLGAFCLTLALSGCVERLLVIRSEPPGAEVFIDGQPVGKTPVQVPFEWYGDREIMLRMEADRPYEVLQVVEPINAPWWQVTPMDFITDVLIPFTLRDRREFDYKLVPMESRETKENLEKRAIELKEKLDRPK